MPFALRWLWRNYPEPIAAGQGAERRMDLLLPDETWELVSDGHRFTEGPAVTETGEFYFSDMHAGKIHRVHEDGTVSVFVEDSPGVNGLMFGSDGLLYACQNGRQRIVRYAGSGREEVVLEDAPCNDLVMLPESGYYTDPDHHRVWRFTLDGERQLVDEGIERPNGIAVSPDHSLLYVSDTRGRFVYSFQVQPDGSLAHKQQYGYLHLLDDGSDSGADGMTVDTQGNLYVTTRLGLQVLDQLGRVHWILQPARPPRLSNVVLGGKEFDTLYVTWDDKVYRRRIKATGVLPWKAPTQPPRPQL